MKADQQMLAVYRHDAHKMRGQSHSSAPDEWLGVRVNQEVPYDADAHAAAMSRPNGEPNQRLPGHETHYRRSIVTGDTAYDPDELSLQEKRSEISALLSIEDATEAHRSWLSSTVPAAFNESVYCPYTSLKYHTLLVAALVDCYRDGLEYDDLGLWYVVSDSPEPVHRTVFRYDGSHESLTLPNYGFNLVIKEHTRGKSAKLASYPFQNFADVWSRLPAHPWTGDNPGMDIQWLDAQLRRMVSWSTALQYLETALSHGVGHDA